jgi:hypothetical protein
MILLVSLCLCSCSGETVETAPADSTPPVAEQQADTGQQTDTSPQVNDEPQVTDEPQAGIEPQIPDDYLSYTNMDETYSISYPQGWQLLLHFLDTMEQDVEGSINNINEGNPVEKTTVIFLAGLPTETGYSPSLSIAVEPNKYDLSDMDDVCESEIMGVKKVVQEFNEISREKTVIDGKDAIILRSVQTMPDAGAMFIMNIFVVVDKNIWTVGCISSSNEEYSKWEDDFNNIVRSLRILK